MMNDSSPLLTPYDSYNNFYKDKHHQNIEKVFDELTKKSGVKIEENRETIKDLHKNEAILDKILKKIKKYKILKGLSIFLIVALFIFATAFTVEKTNEGNPKAWIFLLTWGLCFIFSVLLVLLILKLSKKIKDIKPEKEKYEGIIKELTDLSWEQMATLNSLFDFNIASSLMNITIPLLKFDPTFDPSKYMYLHEKYGFNENNSSSVSTLYVQSGTILGNPFLIERNYVQEWGVKRYTGSIVIHWTETVADSKGNTRVVHRSQTLYAHVDKPIPVYHNKTRLVYGCDAAPNLSFSRTPSNMSGKSNSQIERYVRKTGRKLDKLAKEALLDNDETTNYTRLTNAKFEALFGGVDRDNETEFRLLFTPLAQTNYMKLLTNPKPYGDDFSFQKEKTMNYIQSAHSQTFNFNCDPSYFYSNDYDECMEKFMTYNETYFKALYFDLAPLLSIPMYQTHKSSDFIYKNNYPSNITKYEHEVMANSLDKSYFKHENSKTDAILNASLIHRDGNFSDCVKIRAYSFDTVERVDYQSVLGGDGRMHTVPVQWDEYIPIYQDSKIEIAKRNTTYQSFREYTNTDEFKDLISKNSINNVYSYQRGILAFLLAREIGLGVMDAATEAMNQADAVNEYESLFASCANVLNSDIMNRVEEKVSQVEEKLDQEEATNESQKEEK